MSDVGTNSVLGAALQAVRRLAVQMVVLAMAAAAFAQGAAADAYTIPLFVPASHPTQQGFVRIVNLSDEGGEVSIVAVDDAGERFGPVTFELAPNAVKHFNSTDLERGNAAKGLSGGVGDGEGDWRLEIATPLDIEPLAYIRTEDGFLTAMHGRQHPRAAFSFFNPATNRNQRSLLRLVNRGDRPAEVAIRGVDDANEAPGDGVRLTLPANASRTIDAEEMERDGLADGAGKWRLEVDSDAPVLAMNLAASPTNHLTSLSGAPRTAELAVPLFPAAGGGRQGFVRVRNRSDRNGTVAVVAVDDRGSRYGPVALSIEAGSTVHFNSDDLENGNPRKGLAAGVGRGDGDWRLEFDTELALEVAGYARHGDGFLTAMHGAAAVVDRQHYLPFFNPASNDRQRSLLRLVNPGGGDVRATVRGVDDAGASAGPVAVTVPAGAARTLAAAELEAGGDGLAGSLGDGAGKWRLFVAADGPLRAMSLLESPTGHLTNLSGSLRAPEVELKVSVYGDGEVAAIAPADALDCAAGGSCGGLFRPGSKVVLQARPNAAGLATNWTGCDGGDGDLCEVWVDEDRLALAAFQSSAPLTAHENVAALTPAQLDRLLEYDAGTGIMAFADDTPDADGWAVGDILVSAGVADAEDDRALPFAQRVTGVERTDEGYRVESTFASLGEMIRSGSYDVRSAADAAPTGAKNSSADMERYDLNPCDKFVDGLCRLTFGRSFDERLADGVRVQGVWSGEVQYDLLADFGDGTVLSNPPETEVHHFRFVADMAGSSSVRATVEAGSAYEGAARIANIRLRQLPLFDGITGPARVYLQPTIEVDVVVDARAGPETVSPVMQTRFAATTGFDFGRGGNRIVARSGLERPTIDLEGVRGSAGAEVEAGFVVRVGLQVMENRAAYAEFGQHLGVRQCAGDAAELTGRVGSNAGGELSFFSADFGFPHWAEARSWRIGQRAASPGQQERVGDIGGLCAVDTGEGVSLRWQEAPQRDDDSVPGCGIRYNVYRDGRKIADSLADAAHRDTRVIAERQYCYQVSATLPSGYETRLSERACATVRDAAPKYWAICWTGCLRWDQGKLVGRSDYRSAIFPSPVKFHDSLIYGESGPEPSGTSGESVVRAFARHIGLRYGCYPSPPPLSGRTYPDCSCPYFGCSADSRTIIEELRVGDGSLPHRYPPTGWRYGSWWSSDAETCGVAEHDESASGHLTNISTMGVASESR